MANLASDAIWTAIAERIQGVNTLGPAGRCMPATGATRIKVDRVIGGDDDMQRWRTLGAANASISVEYERSPQNPPQGGTVYLYDLRVTIAVSYNLTAQAALAPNYQVVKSLAQRHHDMLVQALCYPGVLLVTQATGVAYDGSTLSAGTATGIVSGCLFAAPPGMTITRDDGGQSDLYETAHSFTASAYVQAATS